MWEGQLEGVNYLYDNVCIWLQGSVESLKLALGGTVASAGALTDCPFQGDSSSYNIGNAPSDTLLDNEMYNNIDFNDVNVF